MMRLDVDILSRVVRDSLMILFRELRYVCLAISRSKSTPLALLPISSFDSQSLKVVQNFGFTLVIWLVVAVIRSNSQAIGKEPAFTANSAPLALKFHSDIPERLAEY